MASRKTKAGIEALASAVAVLGTVAMAGCTTIDSEPPVPAVLPVRGLHAFAPRKSEVPAAIAFIREVLPREGVNKLILEFNYGFDFQSRPEFADSGAPDRADVRAIARACRESGVELIPQINCLGHQTLKGYVGVLLERHPDLDETAGTPPSDRDTYPRNYCPLHPKVHPILFPLIAELAEAAEAKSFHVGMDEVFHLADPGCPRCRGKDPAALFAGEVQALHAHLRSLGLRMWMWGDRLIDGKAAGSGEWEGSLTGTHRAIDRVPRDVVICDWHYDRALKTPEFFARKGFNVVACSWRNSDVAQDQLADIRSLRSGPDRTVGARALGVVQTTWLGIASFARGYRELRPGGAIERSKLPETVDCFQTLYRAVRGAMPASISGVRFPDPSPSARR